MQRKSILQYTIKGAFAMLRLSAFNNLTRDLKERAQLMPVLFIDHGSPINGIENNAYFSNCGTKAY